MPPKSFIEHNTLRYQNYMHVLTFMPFISSPTEKNIFVWCATTGSTKFKDEAMVCWMVLLVSAIMGASLRPPIFSNDVR